MNWRTLETLFILSEEPKQNYWTLFQECAFKVKECAKFLDITARLEDASHQTFPVSAAKHKNNELGKRKKKKAEQSRGSIFLWSHSDHSCIFILGQVFEWMAHFLMLAQHRQLLRDPFTPQQPLLLYWAAKNTKPGHSGNSSLSPHSLLELYFKLLNNYQHHLLYTESPSSTALYSALLLVEIGPWAHMSEKSHKSIPPDVFIPSAGLHLSGVALRMNELGWEPSGDEASEMKRFNAHIRQVSSCHIGSFLFKHCILFCEGNLYKE